MKYAIWCVALSATIMQGDSNQTNALGRTHFVLGMPQQEYARYGEPPLSAYPATHAPHKILFAPDDDIHAELLAMINDEGTSIKMAMYLFTDKDVGQALHAAKKRGVHIECVTDATCISNKFNKVDALSDQAIPVWVYRASDDNKTLGNAMHHKFMIFKSSCKVVTGSLNITHSAQTSNQENIVVLNDAHSVQKFDAQFEKLKTRCSRLMPQKKSAIAK